MSSHLRRYQQIGEAVARHGPGFVAAALGFPRWIPTRTTTMAARDQTTSAPERLRLLLEDLGVTFVKIGQLLSTRRDLLPPEYIAELSKLLDAAPPVPIEQIRQTIRDELGAGPDEVFARFDPEPLAAASIGQAHTAALLDGTEVVVKIRRPNVVAQVEEDLEILENLAVRASRHWDAAANYNLVGTTRELSQTLRAELDYLQEGRNAERFARNLEGRDDVVVPRVFWEHTTSRVLTLERMSGIRVDDLPALTRASIDLPDLAQRCAGLLLQMMLEDRFFHADPHPGNLFVHDDGTIALIDFGMVGEFDEQLQDKLSDFLVAFAAKDPDALTEAFVALSVTHRATDLGALRESLASFVLLYRDRPLREVSFAHLIAELLGLLRQHRLQLPRELVIVFRVLVIAEGIGVRLDPDFDMTAVLDPYARGLVAKRWSLPALAARVLRASSDSGELLLELPGALRKALKAVDANGLEVHLRAAELEPLVARAERLGNRLLAGMIASALINGIGALVATGRRFRPWGGTLLGLGVTTVGALGSYLLLTARRRP